ncbi:MAG: bifunctional diaminohydroxyphosphoribosylaminopyrimidine deaminase/5-amino-6-(5-phosphoribosylamino)uracil reductase RibD [Leuconostoc suionicum]|uniref:bifunctional diaminohydroxyphosphoribosylaminopyrimidine deaminase/5-amino-6-(5-phosphoribosylamino)uracil reductase RibD n=1 Tax=Leuconostoc suionicum TaxID=1511761 RepID=UPI003F35AE9E
MNDLTWMNLAAHEAARGLPYKTFENPRVGAVLVKKNKIIATGYHAEFGKEHAEINAFNHVKDKNQVLGATLYVTLEPCASRGKVGSCAETIKGWGLHRVVIGKKDPNPTNNSKGIKILKAAGLIVDVLNTTEYQLINPAFDFFFNKQLPYVQLKLVTSQNGLVTKIVGEQTKLTDYLADIDVHKERASKSAIMIGSETMLIDHPKLTVRYIDINHRQPMKIVIDRRGRLRDTDFDFSDNWLIYTENINFANQCAYAKLVSDGLKGILIDLAKQNIQSVMVEGGPSLIYSFLEQNLWQEMLIYATNKILPEGGLKGVSFNQKPQKQLYVGNAVKKIYVNNQGRV